MVEEIETILLSSRSHLEKEDAILRLLPLYTVEELSQPDSKNQPLMLHVCRNNHSKILDHLLERGLDVNVGDTKNTTPLWLAVKYKNFDLMRKLVEHGAEVNGQTPNGFSILTLLVRDSSEPEQIRYLLENKTDIHQIDSWGRDALFYACCENRYENARVLIEHGADMFLEDINQTTCICIATVEKNADILSLFLSHLHDFSKIEKMEAIISNYSDEDQAFALFYLEKRKLSLSLEQELPVNLKEKITPQNSKI